HRIRRTGRAGKTGRSFTLAAGREVYKLRDIERICHTKIKERKIPSAADVMAKKADKILKEAEAVIDTQDIGRAILYLEERGASGEYSMLQYAAAFMKMKLGDDIQDIKQEHFRLDGGSRGRKGRSGSKDRAEGERFSRGKSDRDRSDRDKSGRGKSDRDKSGRDKSDRGWSDRDKSGRGRSDRDRFEKPYDRKEANRNNMYAAFRIRTKKQDKKSK
ncbi:MAG: hypothetical protein NC419_13655, partial [Muribaculaceae bacterium]|nr:hypothetical protein [Muribaculaceae bacterium]